MATTNRIALPQGRYAPPAPSGVRRASRKLLFTVAILITGAAAVALAAALGGGAGSVGQPLAQATNGPDVQVSALPGVDLRPLEGLPALSASSGPFASIDASVAHGGREVGIHLEARSRAAAVVDHPLVVVGGWVRPGAVVLERGLAGRLGLHPGDSVRIAAASGSVRLAVAGIAATTARERYPTASRGLAYVLPETLARVVPNQAAYGSTLLLRLSDRAAAGRIVERIEARYPGRQVSVTDFGARAR
jgi:putative ABC transport system permease protein